MALLVVNDHVLKQAYPGVITGKLSDFCGLVFFPVLLWSLSEVVLRRAPAIRERVACVVVTGVVFALTKTWSPAAAWYVNAIGVLQWPVRAVVATLHGQSAPPFAPVSLTMDATDLIALPALAVAYGVAVITLRPSVRVP